LKEELKTGAYRDCSKACLPFSRKLVIAPLPHNDWQWGTTIGRSGRI